MIPTMPISGQMGQSIQGNNQSNMMSGLPPELVNKILKDVTKNVSGTLSQMASQALTSGVPWGHVVTELIKMAPPEAQGQSLMGGGSPPPGGPQDPNGGGKPPQPPQGAPKEDSKIAPQALQVSQLNPGQLQNSPTVGYNNSMNQGVNLNSLLAPQGQQKSISGPTQDPTRGFFDPGGFNAETNTVRMPGAFMQGWGTNRIKEQQAIMGKQPLQQGEREKIGIELQKDILMETLKLEKEGMLKPNDIFGKFEQASAPFILQRDAFSRFEAAIKDPSPAGDLAAIFNYMKILDPGSTVREGEFATVQNSAGVPQRIIAQYNSVVNGKRLSKEQRADFHQKARSMFKSAESQQKKTTEEFSALAKRNGISDPSRVIRDTGLANEASKYVKTGTHNGQKVGMKADGTIEVIGG